MSEEEKSKFKEYEQKRQKAEEEKERIVKKLEAELRKLKLEIDDIMEKYDEKLFMLIKRKLEYDYRIEQQELYCTRLYLSISTVYEQLANKQKLRKDIIKSQEKLELLARQKEAFLNEEDNLDKAKEAKHASLDAKRIGQI